MARPQKTRVSFMQQLANPVSEPVGRTLSQEIDDLRRLFELTAKVLNVPRLQRERDRLTRRSGKSGFWSQEAEAKRVMARLGVIGSELRRIGQLEHYFKNVDYLLRLAELDSQYQEMAHEDIRNGLPALRDELAALETQTLLSGEWDARPALITVRSQSGVSGAKFADTVLHMYTNWAEEHGYPLRMLNLAKTDKGGVRSATFAIDSPYAYGVLAGEQGTHKLHTVFGGRRITARADVEVLPLVDDDQPEIPDDELQVEVFRSSGPGGQSVNTTDSAVRIRHLPTGIEATCQQQRSQLQNRAVAMQILQARVWERRQQKTRAEQDALRSGNTAERGHIRTYEIAPKRFVRDEGTNYRTENVDAIFGGQISELLLARARFRAQQAAAQPVPQPPKPTSRSHRDSADRQASPKRRQTPR